MKSALQVLNTLVEEKVVSDYAIGGEMAAMDQPLSNSNAALPEEYYQKRKSRKAWREMPFEEKVRQVVELQKRAAPIYAARGKIIVPWTLP